MSPLRPEEILGMLGAVEETQRGFGRGALAGQEMMTREQYEDRKSDLEAIVKGEERVDVGVMDVLRDPEMGIMEDEEFRLLTPEEQIRTIREGKPLPGAIRRPDVPIEVPEGFEITGYTGAGKPIVRKIKVAKPAKPIRPRKMTEGLRKSLGRIIGDLLSAKKFETEEAIGTKREAMDYITTTYGISPKTHPAEWKKYILPIINAYVDEAIPKRWLAGREREKEIYIRDVLMPKLDKIRPQFEKILEEEIAPKVRTFATEEEAEAANLPAGTEVTIGGRRAIIE